MTELQNSLQETNSLALDVQSGHANLKDAFCYTHKNADLLAGIADMTIDLDEFETYLTTFADKMIALDPESSEEYQEYGTSVIEKLREVRNNQIIKVQPEESRSTSDSATTRRTTTKKIAAQRTTRKSK